jgi:hypothetical protein
MSYFRSTGGIRWTPDFDYGGETMTWPMEKESTSSFSPKAGITSIQDSEYSNVVLKKM